MNSRDKIQKLTGGGGGKLGGARGCYTPRNFKYSPKVIPNFLLKYSKFTKILPLLDFKLDSRIQLCSNRGK